MSEIQKEIAALSQYQRDQILQAEVGMRIFLHAVGADLSDENLANTPLRVAKMFVCELLSGEENHEPPEIVSFATPNIPRLPVISRRIPVRSLCAHHLMPISGYADVCCFYALKPEETEIKLPGLSKYTRVVEHFSRRFQLQERLGIQITKHLADNTEAAMVIVRIAATHHCVLHRGVNSENSETVTMHIKIKDDIDKLLHDSVFKTPQEILNYFIAEVAGK